MHAPAPVPSPADAHFARWCRHGDVQALGELFDALAPRLLRLAVHLVGDAIEAEDLVQATFLTAIERRAGVDATRPVLPWLTGVLAHKVRQHRRRAGRVLDPARLARAEVEDPARPLERRELDGEVARAIDALEEPYRQVVLLRLRHGMAPADIAHVLERDAGTVRVQLHRGLERLRQTLPAALPASLGLVTWTPRGLAAIKAAVLEGAAATAAGAPPALVIGGELMGKKVAIAAACVLTAAALVWVRGTGPRARPGEVAEEAPRTAAPIVAPVVAPASPALETGPDAERSAREAVARPGVRRRGRVLDADTGEPLPGARVALFDPRWTTPYDLQRDAPDQFEVTTTGAVRPIGNGDWPRLVGDASSVNREPVLCFDRPRPGEEPRRETVTDAAGGFELELDADGVLEVAAEDHVTRWRAARADEEDLEIALGRGREVAGVVLGPDGAALPEIELALTGQRPTGSVRVPPDPEPLEDGPRIRATVFVAEEANGEGLGSWRVRTDEAGRFRVRLAAPHVAVTVLTPGWGPTMKSWYRVGSEELEIHLQRRPGFHFLDAEDGRPIERVRLLGTELSNRYVRCSGEFHAPGGRLDLPGAAYLAVPGQGAHAFVAWSEGYAPTRVSVPDLTRMDVLEVPLQRGTTPALRGVVTRGGEPLAAAEVALLGLSPLQWSVDESTLLDRTLTDARGAFSLAAPAGSYVLRIRADDAPFLERVTFVDRPNTWMMRAIEGREPFFQVVELPTSAPLVVDLATTSTLEVEVVDTDGVPRAEHVVALRGDQGRQVVRHTGFDGRVRFANLPGGTFQLHTPLASTEGSFGGGELRDVELAPGRVERVRIELPARNLPRHARIACGDAASFEGWRARYDQDEWQPLAVDGTVPMDLFTDRWSLEVVSPDERHWHVSIPKDAPDGQVIELRAGTGRYRGILRHPDGDPWPAVFVHAVPWGAGGSDVRVSTVTDARGEFALADLGTGPYRLRFQTEPGVSLWYDVTNRLANVSFDPALPPDEDGPWLEIRVERDGEPVRITGVVENALGAPLANASVWFERETPTPDGCLRGSGQDHHIVADDRGAFALELPRAPRLTVRVYTGNGQPAVLTRTIEVLGPVEALRLVVP